MNSHSLVFELEREDVLQLFVHCLAQLSLTEKTVLAMYYHENLQLAEKATGFGLTELEVDQMRAKALDTFQTKLAAEIGLVEPLRVSTT